MRPRSVLVAALAMSCVLPSLALGLKLDGAVVGVGPQGVVRVTTARGIVHARLLAVRIPASQDKTSPERCRAAAFTRALRQLLPVGGAVHLETDPAAHAHDALGRLLVYAYRPHQTGYRSVNYALVARGYAVADLVDRRDPFRRALRFVTVFRTAQSRAQQHAWGLWGGVCR
jgi:endonuclease YncB( thermonuclease family)